MRWFETRKWARYVVSGGSAAVCNLVVFSLCVYVFNIHGVLSSAIATMCAVSLSFFMQKYFTFKDASRISANQLSRYALTFITNLVLTTGLYALISDVVAIKVVSQILAAGLTAVLSFYIYHFFVFRSKEVT